MSNLKPNSNQSNTITKEKFQELLLRARSRGSQQAEKLSQIRVAVEEKRPEVISFAGTGVSLSSAEGEEAAVEFLQEITSTTTPVSTTLDQKDQKDQKEGKQGTGVSREVVLNKEQLLFSTTLLSGQDLVLIGAAGTGKTTCVGVAIKELLKTGQIGKLQVDTKHLSHYHLGVLVCSFTRKAVNNIRRALPQELKPNALTLHKVLEFEPTFYEIEDPLNKGSTKTTMKFEPKRNALNPLPSTLTTAFFEESSMIGTELYNLWKQATPHQPQEIFIGDIQQLPPVFGSAILGFKMALLPVIQLTEVYRQAKLSPIIRLAHGILDGDPYQFDKTVKTREEVHPYLGRKMMRKYCPALERWNEESEHGSLKFQIWQKNQDAENACNAFIQQCIAWIKEGYYNPKEDIIICPFGIAVNKKEKPVFGTTRINNGILEYLSQQRGSPTYEIIAGFNKHYYAEGDRVLYDKEDAVITSIKRNTNYYGRLPQEPSVWLSREGHLINPASFGVVLNNTNTNNQNTEKSLEQQINDDFLLDSFSLGQASGYEDEEERTHAASHAVTIRFSYSDEELELRSAAEINNLSGGHALTVHKLQGSENEKIILVLHKSHAVMVQRELLYTAVTRARQNLHIICETDTFFSGVKSQKVKGTTLEEKIEFFKGKGTFQEMQEEMNLLRMQKEIKERKLLGRLASQKLSAEIAKEEKRLQEKNQNQQEPEPDLEQVYENEGGQTAILSYTATKKEPTPVPEQKPLTAIEKLKLKLLENRSK